MANQINTKIVDKSLFKMLDSKTRQAAMVLYKAAPFYDANSTIEFGNPISTKLFVKDFIKDRKLTGEDIFYLQKLIDTVYTKSRYSPTQLPTTNQDLIDSNITIDYINRKDPGLYARRVIACVMREWRSSFKIFINDNVELDAYDPADLHEKGHILFNHTQAYSVYITQFKKELEKIWDTKLAKYFDAKTFKNSKDKIVRLLFNQFSNIAQDMEINSKLFDNGEWIKAKKCLSRSGLLVIYNDLSSKFDSLSGLAIDNDARKVGGRKYLENLNDFYSILKNIMDRINGEEGDFQFCYPANKGWPEKLDWMTYMVLLVKNIDETMDQIMQNISAACAAAGQGKPGQGQSPGGKTISQDVLDEYCDNLDKDKDARNGANEEGEEDDEGEEDAFEASARGRNEGGDGRSGGSGAVKVEFETCDTFNSFTKYLAKHCLGKKNRKLNSDVLYNSNRGKFASRVVVPRRHFIEKWMPTSCTLLIDVSGSVPTDYVERVINSIVDTNSGIDLKHSHIIFCDTRVVSDEIMSARTKSVYAGGGTEIARGIKYVKEKGYCKKKTDKLFIISDGEDELNSWLIEAEGIPGIKYFIGYNVVTEEDCNRILDRGYGRTVSDNEFKQRWNKTFKTVFICEKLN